MTESNFLGLRTKEKFVLDLLGQTIKFDLISNNDTLQRKGKFLRLLQQKYPISHLVY